MASLRTSVSVVIPTYNAGQFIDDAVQSVWRQSQQAREIILVDDASTDDTARRVAMLQQRSPVPLHWIPCAHNSGSPAKPMNIGVDFARGDLIAILDQDDVWMPSKIVQQSSVLTQCESVSFVCSLFGFVDDPVKSARNASAWTTRLAKPMTEFENFYRCKGKQAFDLFVRYENFVGGFPGFMFRRCDWQRRGGFDESLPVAADYDFLFWLSTQGDAGFVPQTHYLRREHDNNVTHSEVPRLTDVIRILMRYISPDDYARHEPYRAALASKLMRLAQFFGYCGCHEQASQMLSLYHDVRCHRGNVWIRPFLSGQFAVMPLLGSILQFHGLRRVSSAEATACVDVVRRIVARGETTLSVDFQPPGVAKAA